MRSKSDYAKYLLTPHWTTTRESYLEWHSYCYRCHLPRWLAKLVYYQDLHVHHRNYKNLGNEGAEDLEPLCRRCHEIETFGRSPLKAPKEFVCKFCQEKHWNPYQEYCPRCWWILDRDIPFEKALEIEKAFPETRQWIAWKAALG